MSELDMHVYGETMTRSVRLSVDALDNLRGYATENGVTVSSLFEAFAGNTAVFAAGEVNENELISTCKKYDVMKRNRVLRKSTRTVRKVEVV